MSFQSQLTGFWRNEKETVITSLIIGVMGHLLINKSFSFNRELIAIILVSFFFVAIIKAIVRAVRGDIWAKENYRKNKLWIIISLIALLLFLAPKTNLFATFTGSFGKMLFGTGAATAVAKTVGVGAALGVPAAVILGLPTLLAAIGVLIALFLFGGSLSKILSFFADNIAIVVIVGAALLLLFILRSGNKK